MYLNMENIIEVKNLVKKFKKFMAVDDISFDVQEGEIFALLGPNGAGKTTTIKMLTTLLMPTAGSAVLAGYNVATQRDKVRESIGVVFQNVALDKYMTGRENLEFHAWMYSMPAKQRKERIQEVLKLVDLEDRANVLVENYSGGMQRRLEIARGLMHYPKVLFLDEPTLGLDTQTKHKIWDYIMMLNKERNVSIVLTTHYMEEADFLSNRVAIIDKGKIIALDTPKNLKNIIGADIVTLEMECGDCMQFKDLPYVHSIDKHGDFVSLSVESGEKKIPMLIEFAQSQGIKIRGVELHKPSLEDVFLRFTGTTIRERNEQ